MEIVPICLSPTKAHQDSLFFIIFPFVHSMPLQLGKNLSVSITSLSFYRPVTKEVLRETMTSKVKFPFSNRIAPFLSLRY